MATLKEQINKQAAEIESLRTALRMQTDLTERADELLEKERDHRRTTERELSRERDIAKSRQQEANNLRFCLNSANERLAHARGIALGVMIGQQSVDSQPTQDLINWLKGEHDTYPANEVNLRDMI